MCSEYLKVIQQEEETRKLEEEERRVVESVIEEEKVEERLIPAVVIAEIPVGSAHGGNYNLSFRSKASFPSPPFPSPLLSFPSPLLSFPSPLSLFPIPSPLSLKVRLYFSTAISCPVFSRIKRECMLFILRNPFTVADLCAIKGCGTEHLTLRVRHLMPYSAYPGSRVSKVGSTKSSPKDETFFARLPTNSSLWNQGILGSMPRTYSQQRMGLISYMISEVVLYKRYKETIPPLASSNFISLFRDKSSLIPFISRCLDTSLLHSARRTH